MITELSVIDKIEVLEDGQIQVRRADKVLRDGVEIAKTYHRHVLAPGDDFKAEEKCTQDICKVAWTPAVIKAYQDAQAAARPK
jgi:hypothetical protein